MPNSAVLKQDRDSETYNKLKQYCLRYCGHPVIDIQIDDTQIDDAIDDALNFWRDFHFDGTERRYLAHRLTEEDIQNGYITLPNGIQSVVRVLNYAGNAALSSSSLTNIQYQLRLNDLWDLSSVNMSDYWIARQYLSLIDDVLNGDLMFEHTKYKNRLTIHAQWSKEFDVGSFIVMEVYQYVDNVEFGAVYDDPILKKLAAAYTKLRWGNNLLLFSSVQLPGGVNLNGAEIVNQAKDEIAKIEEEFIDKYTAPLPFFVG